MTGRDVTAPARAGTPGPTGSCLEVGPEHLIQIGLGQVLQAGVGKIPALVHSTSMPPSRSWATDAIRRQSSVLATSASTNETPRPARRPRLATELIGGARATSKSRPVISTRAPLRAKTLAIPLPIPVPPSHYGPAAIDVNMRPSFRSRHVRALQCVLR